MMKTQGRVVLTHKQRLVREGVRHFRAHGFHGTTVDDLLEAAKAPKGSFYHHFGTKDEFAREVIDAYMVTTIERLTTIAAKQGPTGLAKTQAYFRVLLDRLSLASFRSACLIGSFATELAPASDYFSGLLAAALEQWRLAIRKLIDEGQKDGSIRRDMSSAQLSHVVLALIQGAMTLSVAHRTRDALAEVEKSLPKLLA